MNFDRIIGRHGTGRHRIVAGGLVVALAASGAIAVADYPAAAATTDSTTSTGGTVDPSTLPPAPAGFAGQLVTTYSDVYGAAQHVAQLTSRTVNLTSVSAYQAKIDALTSEQLAGMYYATQQTPGWSQLPELMRVVSSAGTDPASSSGSTPSGSVVQPRFRTSADATPAESGSTSGERRSTSTWPAATVTGGLADIAAAPLDATFEPSSAVHEYDASDCGEDEASGLRPAILAVQLAEIIFEADKDVAEALELIPAVIIDAVVVGALQVTETGLDYKLSLIEHCIGVNSDGYIENIDNTTFQSWGLLNSMQGSITKLEASSAGLSTSLSALSDSTSTNSDSMSQAMTQQLTALQTALQGALGTDTSTAMNLLQNVSSAVGGNGEAVAAATAAIKKAVADATDTIDGELSDLQTSLGNATDTLTTLINANTKQVLGGISGLHDQNDTEFQANLRLSIERALSDPNAVPIAQFELPTSANGYLDSTPVGVQEVVTDLLAAVQQTGEPFNSNAVKYLNDGNTALAAGGYKQAWIDYLSAYGFLAK